MYRHQIYSHDMTQVCNWPCAHRITSHEQCRSLSYIILLFSCMKKTPTQATSDNCCLLMLHNSSLQSRKHQCSPSHYQSSPETPIHSIAELTRPQSRWQAKHGTVTIQSAGSYMVTWLKQNICMEKFMHKYGKE